MEEDQAFLESVQFAIQAQEEIRQQLQQEIAQYEGVPLQRSASKGRLTFFERQLKRSINENESIRSEIQAYKEKELPSIVEQIFEIDNRLIQIQGFIDQHQVRRSPAILEQLENLENRKSIFDGIASKLREEIKTNTTTTEEITQKISDLRLKMRNIDDDLKKRKGRVSWQVELEVEKQQNEMTTVRQRIKKKGDLTSSLPARVFNRRHTISSNFNLEMLDE